MSGLVRGKIECYLTTNNRQFAGQVVFKLLFDFFSNHPQYTLIALQYGTTSGPGTTGPGLGTAFYDQPNSFGYNSFFVVRQNATTTRPFDVYHMWQWSGSTGNGSPAFGASPGNPGLINGSANPIDSNHVYIGHAAAIGIGGTGGSVLSPNNGNPWKGGNNANGADTKPATGPIWGAPSGGGTGVIVWPRSNSNFGVHRSLTQNMGGTIWSPNSDAATPGRMHIVSDDDSFAIALDTLDNNTWTLAFSGLYSTRNNLSVAYPYVVLDSYNGLPWPIGSTTTTNLWGDVAGTNSVQGGIVTPISATVVTAMMDHYSFFSQDSNYWPDKGFTSPTFNTLDIPVGAYDVNGPQNYAGFWGQLDFIREMYNVNSSAVFSDFSRLVIGNNVTQATHWAIPWDKTNKTNPRSGQQRTGINFVASALNPNV